MYDVGVMSVYVKAEACADGLHLLMRVATATSPPPSFSSLRCRRAMIAPSTAVAALSTF